MKYLYILLLPLVITGCVKRPQVEFAGTTPGIKSGVFIVKTPADSTLYGENIKNGKFTISKRQLKYPGYYMMGITDDNNNDKHNPFEVYLDDGKYTIETENGQLYKYPKITSPSKIQQQLSAFYTLADKLSSDAEQQSKQLNAALKIAGHLSPLAYTQLLNKLSAAEMKVTQSNIIAFRQFLKQYPNSDISAHLMAKLNYEDDPVTYYTMYKTLAPAAKNSDDGKEIGDRLSHLIKLVAGAKAPAIYGKTPDGKPFDEKTINKKLILVEFWRASNDISRRNHQQITEFLTGVTNPAKFGVVSVSLDTKADWWLTAIKQDNLTWPQVADLKGDSSPNAANWNITQIPTYYLVDSQWNIVVSNIAFDKLNLEISNYLEKHRL